MPVHPKMNLFLENLLAWTPKGYTPTLEDIRSRNDNLPAGTVEAVHDIADRMIRLPESEIPIRIYTPEGEGPFPVIVFFHGGGFVSGSIQSHDPVCRSICIASESMVVSVDYRLAPEHPFPAASNDCFAAAKWIYDHAEELKADKTRLSVAGDSAGGNLATVVALMAKEQGGLTVYKQVLLYPVTDYYRHGEPAKYASYEENGSGYFLTGESMGLFGRLYFQNPEEDSVNPYGVPIKASDLSGLPPALIITAEFDPLRDEGEEYGARLREDGVEVVVKRMDGFIHGFFNIFSLMDSKDDIKEVYELIGSFLKNDTKESART
jgi:acetyl esterase